MDDIDIATERRLFPGGGAVEKMICGNCRNFQKGICNNRKNLKESIKEDDTCASWEEKLFDEEKDKLRSSYEKIIKVLKKYCDLKEEYYSLIALWIIGTYFHKQFPTYPYLFFNAMKGSGKTRLMKLILYLSKDGNLMNNMSEAVLFRTASQRTIGIDEFENIGSKEKALLRELLNSAYKKGTVVERARKVYGDEGDGWEIERYDVYCPLLIANISGMDEVLGDRCISLIIDKSSKKYITRLLELFDLDPNIKEIKTNLCSLCSVVTHGNVEKMMQWNDFITTQNDKIGVLEKFIYNNETTTLTTHTTLATQTTLTTLPFFESIFSSNLDSRMLELFFPLFIISESIGEDIFRITLKIAEEFVNAKKDDDFYESRDVSFIEFISNSEKLFEGIANGNFVREKDILERYRYWMEWEEKNDEWKWLNGKWIGKALKRLNLTLDKKRASKGIEVVLNFKKAHEKAKMFKSDTESEQIETDKVKPSNRPEKRTAGPLNTPEGASADRTDNPGSIQEII